MLRQLRQQPTDSQALGHGASLPTLVKAALPLDELSQLQRRLAHLLTSLAELQDHVANAVNLEEWPWLLNRHVALVSQTHSLSLLLSRANSTALHAQLARFEEALLDDARQHNKFSASSGDGDGSSNVQKQGLGGADDALFGGRADAPQPGAKDLVSRSHAKLPAVQYSEDDANPLRRIAPHPFAPLDATKSQTVIPSLLLPRGIDNQTAEQTHARWETWLRENGANLALGELDDASSEVLARIVMRTSPTHKLSWLRLVRSQIYDYDKFARRAQVSFVHAREATDEYGQRYDWRLRLDDEEESEEEEIDGDGDDGDEEDVGGDAQDEGADDNVDDAKDIAMTDGAKPFGGEEPVASSKRAKIANDRQRQDDTTRPPLTLADVTTYLQTGAL